MQKQEHEIQGKVLIGVVFEEDGWYYAVCLNHYLMTMAKSFEEIGEAIDRMLLTYLDACRREDRAPFADLGPAPDEYWRRFDIDAEVALKHRQAFDREHGVPLDLLAYEFRKGLERGTAAA